MAAAPDPRDVEWPALRRIAIVGPGGAAKTRLARGLGAALGIPVTHLDLLFYSEDGSALAPEPFARLQRRLAAGERWIADGNYASTLPIRLARADAVILLDPGPLACLWGIACRRLRHRGRRHPEAGVVDRIGPGFLGYVWRYRRAVRPRVEALIVARAPEARVVVLASRRAARRFLARAAGERVRLM